MKSINPKLSMKLNYGQPYQIEPGRCKKKATFADVYENWPKGDRKNEHEVFETKEDGLRYLLQVKPRGAQQNYMTSRHISKQTGKYVEKQDSLPHVRDYQFPDRFSNSVFDGEWCSEGGISHDAQHAIAHGKGYYVVWDLLVHNGKDLRKMSLWDRLCRLYMLKIFFPPWMRFVNSSHNAQELLKRVESQGGEGIIKKDMTAPYGEQWVKVKDDDNYDVVIYDYEPTKSEDFKAKGWIGAVRIAQVVLTDDLEKAKAKYGKRVVHEASAPKLTGKKWVCWIAVGRASNMTQAVRDDLSKNQKKYIGSVIEIKANMRYENGYFRSPRFIQFRPDKSPHQCIFEA